MRVGGPGAEDGFVAERERTILERLADPRVEERTIEENTEALARSVLRHLQRMLNTRHGFSETLPDFGLPDIADLFHSGGDAAGVLRKAIRTTIEKYEPRLRNVRIEAVEGDGDALALRFEIKAELVTAEERAHVLFETTVDSSGEVRVDL